MVTETFVIGGAGLRSRQAERLVRTASKFLSRISVTHLAKTINAKSMMGVFSLVVAAGESVTVTAEGEDEAEAMQAIRALVGGELAGAPGSDE